MNDARNCGDDIILNIIRNQIKEDKIRVTDIVDGEMVTCSVCGKPRREYIEYDGKKVLSLCMCECDLKAENEKKRQEEYQKKAEQINRLKAASMIDKLFDSATFDKFKITKDNKKNFEMCKRYVDKFQVMAKNNQGLLFYGDTGTGKSFTAACIANALINSLRPVVMVPAVKILQTKFEDEEEQNDIYTQAELLIIDDFGAERNTAYAVDKMYAVIDKRYRERKPIIITTNLTVEAMKQNTDLKYSRIYDRLFEMCYPVLFKGVSHRKIAAKERYNITKKLLEED